MPVPANASGLVFIRRQDNVIHLDAQGQAQYLGYRVKILHQNALQLGNLSIVWNPSSGAPTVHSIKVHRNGEVIDVLAKSAFEILRRENQLEQAWLDGILTAVLRVPDLRVGDELEVEQTTRLNDPTLGSNDTGILFLAPNPAPGRMRLGLNWIDGQKPVIKMSDDMASVVKRSEGGIEFLFDNPAKLNPAKDAPARFQWQRYVEFSDFADWAAVSRRFAQLFAKSAKFTPDSSLKQEASRIAKANTSPLARADAALKLVQQDIRYVYVGLDGGNFTPAKADDTWQRRYGDCKGKTALLLGLLAELGIDAEAVLASNAGTDDGLDQRLPTPRMFDHVLVRAHIGGADYFLDGTLPPVVSSSKDPASPYRWILPLTDKGSALQRIERKLAKRPDEISLHEIDARGGFSKPAKITSTTIVRGAKALQYQAQFSALTPDELRNAFRQEMVGDTWQTVDDVQWRYDQKAQASVLVITGTGTIDWDNDGGSAKSLAMPGGGFSPPERRIRATGQNQDLPYYNKPEFDCNVTTVRLPSDTLAKHWSHKPGYDTRIFGQNYYRAFELRDGSMRMVRGFRVEKEEIDAASAAKDNNRLADFDNSMAWIFYDPSARREPVRSGKTVPSTTEIDWTADNVPCLGSSPAP